MTQTTLKGSCLCGAVKYEVTGEAKRFTNQFCATCGSRLPRQAPGTDVVLIPAGSLDDDAPIKPQGRVFYGSRAGWSCADDGLPAYPEYPSL